ncbi:hypothetical protein [Emergencia sp. 1XD21-10]|uniref:coiled-coil domain-containing protein n=1 Tax=Emergencia sp. 1XD21-10 TaxID=2304569 RepID=UPI00137969D6|nr:hypothetical protein [Emergencia sp. 1XD21-10]NCE98110.1 hypothetical protein [Emergencia sp. 1XD21-10]
MQMNRELTEQILQEKNQKMKRQGNRLLIGFFLLFVFGYTFFFTSTLWLPVSYDNIQVTKVGSSIEANDRKVTLLSWTYDKERHEQEVILDIHNSATDGMDTYSFSVMDKNMGSAEVETVVCDKNFVVLKIKKLHPRWTELSLRIDAAAGREDTEFQRMRLYTSKKEVKVVEEIPSMTEQQYRKLACELRIGFYEKEIYALLEKNAEFDQNIRNAKTRIEDLKAEEKYQTNAEKMETLAQIQEIQAEITDNQSKKDKAAQEMQELKERISLQRELKSTY